MYLYKRYGLRRFRPALVGVFFSGLGNTCFTFQDAILKWLVATYSVAEVILIRSLVVLFILALLSGRRTVHEFRQSRGKLFLVIRASLMLMAWLSYYQAAKQLGLAELTTIYFIAPVIVVVLAILILKEEVSVWRWAAVAGGFLGVVIAA